MRWAITYLLLSLLAMAQQPAESPTAELAEASLGTITVPAGTEIPLRLAQGISTKNAKPGDPVYAETAFPITQNNRIIIPAGTFVQGRISEVRRAGRVKGRAEFLMHFTTIIFRSGYTVMLPGSVEGMPGAQKETVKDKEGTIQQAGSKGKDAGTVATTAGTGATVGAIADRGAKGAAIGGGVGAAAGLAAVLLTRGPDVTLPSGTSVQMVLQRPLVLQEDKLRRQ